MRRLGFALFMGLLIVWTSACTPTRPPAPPKVDVKGMVTVDGKNMHDGEILFTFEGEPGVVMTIKEGAYSGQAHQGKNRVDVFSYKEGPPNPTDPAKAPSKINTVSEEFSGPKSKLTADVKQGGGNEFPFEVKSAK